MKTQYEPTCLPVRTFDWTCIADDYEGGDPVGYGETEEEAIAHYLEQTN